MKTSHIGFMGAGGIARAHAYALNSLKFFYDEAPDITLEAVTSRTRESRTAFAREYEFEQAQEIGDFVKNEKIDTIFILGPNNVHWNHLNMALDMPNVKNIYLEKPVCGSEEEENEMHKLLEMVPSDVRIQVGFQFLQFSPVREALQLWETEELGNPFHFEFRYYHGDYLQKSYRDKRRSRLGPAPEGGAMADLGSHSISMMMAFLGEDLQILNAQQAGSFTDVDEGSDLFSSLSLFDPHTRATGTLSASRVSSGTGDLFSFILYGDKGSLKFSTHKPDYFEYYLEKEGNWVRKDVGSRYNPVTSFPSGHVPGGWLRAMIHAHYIFLTGDKRGSFIPDLKHGLAVQRIVRETADHLNRYRELVGKFK